MVKGRIGSLTRALPVVQNVEWWGFRKMTGVEGRKEREAKRRENEGCGGGEGKRGEEERNASRTFVLQETRKSLGLGLGYLAVACAIGFKNVLLLIVLAPR